MHKSNNFYYRNVMIYFSSFQSIKCMLFVSSLYERYSLRQPLTWKENQISLLNSTITFCYWNKVERIKRKNRDLKGTLIAMKHKHCSFSLTVRYPPNTVSIDIISSIYLLYGLLNVSFKIFSKVTNKMYANTYKVHFSSVQGNWLFDHLFL